MNAHTSNDDAHVGADSASSAEAAGRDADAPGKDDNWDPYDDSDAGLDGRTQAPLWRRLEPDWRPHEHEHPPDDPWDDRRRIDGIIAHTRTDLAGHPPEQIERALTKWFSDSNLHVRPDAVRAVALDIASGAGTDWSARTLQAAIDRQRARDTAETDTKGTAPHTEGA